MVCLYECARFGVLEALAVLLAALLLALVFKKYAVSHQ
jgi:hypothetical protein